MFYCAETSFRLTLVLIPSDVLAAYGIESLLSAKSPRGGVHVNSAGEVTPPSFSPGVRRRAGGGGLWVGVVIVIIGVVLVVDGINN